MRLLVRAEICGREYPVYEGSDEECVVDGEQVDAFCENAAARIVIAASLADTIKVDRALHEGLHAIITASGLVQSLKKLAKTEAIAEEIEEEIVVRLTTALRPFLKSLGWREPKRIGKPRRRSK